MLNKIPSNHLKADEKGLLNVLSKVKKQGYESIRSAQAQGVRDIGYPIFDANGVIIAALAVPFLEYLDGSRKVSFTEAQVKIKEAAIEASLKLGYEFD